MTRNNFSENTFSKKQKIIRNKFSKDVMLVETGLMTPFEYDAIWYPKSLVASSKKTTHNKNEN